MTKRPSQFKTPTDEADAIDRLVAGDVAKRLKTYDAARLARFKADGMRYAVELRLLNCSNKWK